MPRVDPNTTVTLSVLDRLIDQEPESTQEAPAGRLQSLREMKAGLWRDLAALLNTKRGENDIPPEFQQVNSSVLAFGLVDFTSFSLKSPADQNRLRRAIEQGIRTFEPRLSGVVVTLEERGELDPALRFRVDALLQVDPAPEPISFDTVLQADTCHILVHGK